jgi:MFS family permease
VAPLAGSVALQYVGYRSYFLGCGAVTALTVAMAAFLPRTAGTEAGDAGRSLRRFLSAYKEVFRLRGFLWLFAGGALLEPFGFYLFNMYSSLRLSDLGLTDAAVGAVAGGAMAAYLLFCMLGSVLIDRLPVRAIFAASMVGAGLSCSGMGFAPSAWFCAVCMVCYRICYSWVHPLWNVRLAHFAPKERFASCLAAVSGTQCFVAASIGVLAAAAVTVTGVAPLMGAGGLVAALGGVVTAKAPRTAASPGREVS